MTDEQETQSAEGEITADVGGGEQSLSTQAPAEPPAVVADAASSVDGPLPAPPSLAWHWCHHRNKEFHVLAGSEAEAKEKFKRAVGIRGSIHPVTAVAVKDYQPTEADLELEKNLSKATE